MSNQMAHMVGNGQRAGEARRFDAKQIHQARHAMVARPLDKKIRCGCVGAMDLGTDAGVARRQRTIAQAGPVFAHFAIKNIPPRCIDQQVIGRIHPLHIRTELGLPTQIQRQVYPGLPPLAPGRSGG